MVGILERISRALVRQRLRRALLSEISGLSPAERDAIFRDMGLSNDDMGRVLNGSLDGTLLERMLRRVDIDPITLARREPETARDMQRVCAQCGEWGRCRSDLDAGGASSSVPRYCPNRDAILALAPERTA